MGSLTLILLSYISITCSFSVPSSPIRSHTPKSTPEQVIHSQLVGLKSNDMPAVFRYASTGNKERVNSDVVKFGEMVRSGPYSPLIGHKHAEILLINDVYAPSLRQFLVRVVPSSVNTGDDYDDASGLYESRKATTTSVDYWWHLSRSTTSGPDLGCYMVDAVIPYD